MPVKLTRPIIRVVERWLGLVGTPLPTSVEDMVRLTTETRALRPWEEFDARIVRWHGRFSQGAVAAEFGFGMFRTAAEGSASCPKGTIFVLDGIRAETATQLDFVVADNSTLPASAAVSQCYRDMREGSFLAAPLPLALGQNTQAGAGTVTLQKTLTGTAIEAEPDELASQWGWIFLPRAGQAAGDVLALRSGVVNTSVIARTWGRIIYPR